MKKILFLAFMLVSITSFGQFVNYTNINGRYKWIAGKFDSTFTLPSGTTPSLRVGGGTGPGALFYSTTDSTVYEYTGSQWRPLHGSDTGRIQIAYVRNTTASPMTTGQIVYINGSTGNVPTVALAVNTADSTSAMTFGFVRGAIPVNGFGWITTFGPINGINTNAYDEGEVIYLDSVAGQFTHDKPQAPYHMVTLGYIIKKSGNGIIFVKIQNGYELEELHNVRITSPVPNKAILAYDSVAQLWKDTTLNAIGGITGSGNTNYVPKFTSSNTLGNSSMYDSSGFIKLYKDFKGTPQALQNDYFASTINVDGRYGWGLLVQQNDSITTGAQIPLLLRKGLLTNDKPRPNYGTGLGMQLQDDAGTWRASSYFINRITDSTAAGFKTNMQLYLPNGSGFVVPFTAYADSSIRLPKLAGSGTRYVVANSSGDLGIGTDPVTGSGTTNYIPKFTSSSAIGNSGITDDGSTITFSTSATERMRLDASGNLGIGTTSPASLLHINGSTSGAVQTYIQNSNGGTNSSAELVFGTWSGAIPTGSGNPGPSAKIVALNTNSNNATTDLIFHTYASSLSSAERMRITSGGNVGIGTTNPTDKLLVAGNIHAYASGGIDADLIASTGAGSTTIWLRSNGVSYFNGGNVGIGTTSPTALLDVRGTGASTDFRLSRNIDPNIYLSINAPGNTPNRSTFGINGTNVMTLNASGNVGIGTTSPATLLSISGSTPTLTINRVAAGNYGKLSFTDQGTEYAYIQPNGATGVMRYDVGPSAAWGGVHAFFTDQSERMRITSGGELLINTTSDAGDYKLQVNGNVYQKGNLYIDQTVGSNYITLHHAGQQTWYQRITTANNSSFVLRNDLSGGTTAFLISESGNAEFAGSIKTAAPSGGTAKPWKLGTVATVSPTSPDRTIEVEIDGVTYYIHAKTTNN